MKEREKKKRDNTFSFFSIHKLHHGKRCAPRARAPILSLSLINALIRTKLVVVSHRIFPYPDILRPRTTQK